ncbi:dual specificity protein phosphatase 15 isoform X3 [Zalophus californianus]|uniref:Dual specificity protein phosphatase 15 n=1 Tax=Zalophus californianus TaxID=9704 RepID=A0A6J2FGY1_ZALCA|nr:dual specificity protein phosphatase 15 isoform X3 [Zalophus californianus]
MGNGMTKVLPGLYLGNFIDAKDPDQLGRNKITHIISIHESPQPLLQDITYLRIPVADTPEVPIKKHFKECINFIHCCRLNGGNCLVHCFAGISRSTTIVTAYVMTVTGLGWRDVLEAIKATRPIANPNPGFRQQLEEFGWGSARKDDSRSTKEDEDKEQSPRLAQQRSLPPTAWLPASPADHRYQAQDPTHHWSPLPSEDFGNLESSFLRRDHPKFPRWGQAGPGVGGVAVSAGAANAPQIAGCTCGCPPARSWCVKPPRAGPGLPPESPGGPRGRAPAGAATAPRAGPLPGARRPRAAALGAAPAAGRARRAPVPEPRGPAGPAPPAPRAAPQAGARAHLPTARHAPLPRGIACPPSGWSPGARVPNPSVLWQGVPRAPRPARGAAHHGPRGASLRQRALPALKHHYRGIPAVAGPQPSIA